MKIPAPFPRTRRVQSEDEIAVLHDEKCAGCGAPCTYCQERQSKHVVRLHLPDGWVHVHVYGGKRHQTTTRTCRRPMRQARVTAVACPGCRPTVTKDEYGYDVMDAPFLRKAQQVDEEGDEDDG